MLALEYFSKVFNKSEASNHFFKYIRLLVISSTVLALSSQGPVMAMSELQRKVIKTGVLYANTEEECSIKPPGAISPPVAGSKIYVLGDSIVNQSSALLKEQIELKEFVVSKINSDPGRAISLDTAGSEPSGLAAVDEDKDIIADSKVIVISLGTNSGTEDLKVQIPNLINKINGYNSTARIFWVNLFYNTNGGATNRNNLITEAAATYNFSIINTVNANIELDTDNIHPSVDGNLTFAKTVADGIATGGSSPANTSKDAASGALGIEYPSLSNESQVKTNLTNYLKEKFPNSPWLTISDDFGTWLFNESKTRNINPLMVAAIGKQENGFGTSDRIHVKQYHNYFGMKGDTPIDIPNSDYKGFNSPEEGMKYFLDKIKENIQNGQTGSYKDVENMYDYLSVHQTGKIVYPGESLGTYNGGMDGFDSTMQVYISWTTTDHPNDVHDGTLYNPGIYYTNSVEFINRITGLSLSDVPTRGRVLVAACQNLPSSTGGSGLLDSTGYAFPLEPQTKRVGGIGVGWTGLIRPDGVTPVHHDRTAAFDLFSTDSADVYSIYDGVIDYVDTNFNGVPGCTGMQLHADDTYYYVFLHVKNPTVTEGTRVKAGQKIAEIADSSFTGTCFGSAPHMHIDRGCVIGDEPQFAGRDSCRDPDFVKFLSDLFSRLPG